MGKVQYFGVGIQFDVWTRGRAHVQVDHQLCAIKTKKKIKYKDSKILSRVSAYMCYTHRRYDMVEHVYIFTVITFNKINELNPIMLRLKCMKKY